MSAAPRDRTPDEIERSIIAKIDRAYERIVALQAALARATYLAEHLFQMIPLDDWRATGGDDGQGHYEGDYRAEGIAEEIRRLAALAAAWGEDGPDRVPPAEDSAEDGA